MNETGLTKIGSLAFSGVRGYRHMASLGRKELLSIRDGRCGKDTMFYLQGYQLYDGTAWVVSSPGKPCLYLYILFYNGMAMMPLAIDLTPTIRHEKTTKPPPQVFDLLPR
ncbi:hypothetical protein CHU98_g11735 [Xylaria longipes]|nr:hypothetical protein CHU98_g11735 [Xylaria longipes]